jgi:hypothetical protein
MILHGLNAHSFDRWRWNWLAVRTSDGSVQQQQQQQPRGGCAVQASDCIFARRGRFAHVTHRASILQCGQKLPFATTTERLAAAAAADRRLKSPSS